MNRSLTLRPSLATGVVALLLLLAGGCDRDDRAITSEARVDSVLASLDLGGRAQLLLIPRLGARQLGDTAALAGLVAEARAGRLSGVWFDGGSAGEIAAATRRLAGAVGSLPLILAAELDGGPGARIEGAVDLPVLRALASAADVDAAEAAGRQAAAQARMVGINLGVVRAPPIEAGSATAVLRRRGEAVLPAMNAYAEAAAGEGRITGVIPLWSERGAAAQRWDLARLSAFELELLHGVRRAAPVLFLEPLVLPAITGDTLPLAESISFLRGVVRRDLEWEGVIGALLPDDAGGADSGAIVRSLAAGADLIVGVADRATAAGAIVAAVQRGELNAGRIDAAARRVLHLRASLATDTAQPLSPDSLRRQLRSPEALETATALMSTTSSTLPGAGDARPHLGGTGEGALLITPNTHGGTLLAEMRRSFPRITHIALDLTADTAAIRSIVAAALENARTVVVADFPGASAFSLGADLIRGAAGEPDPSLIRILFDPAAGALVGPPAPSIVVWGTGPVAQHTAANLLASGGDRDERLRLQWPPARMLQEASAASVGMDEAVLQRADRALQDAIARELFPGAVLVVGRRGGLVRSRGYGRTASPLPPSSEEEPTIPRGAAWSHTPADASATVYDIASLTKVVGTTAAFMRLVEEGRVELDAPVQRYLPEYRAEGANRVTVRHLLTHTSGLPAGLWLYGSARSPRQALRQVLAQHPRRAPGERVEYSDLGMILLAEVAERAAGMPLDHYLAREVFAPLGMESTMYIPPDWLRSRMPPTATRSEREFILHGVVHDGNAFRLGGVAGHAGLFSTGRDLAVFAQTMLNGGAYGTSRVFTPETVAAFSRRQPGAQERALGWDTPAARSSAGRFLSTRSFGHTGYTGTSLWIDPELDLFVVLLTNRTLNRTSAADMLRVRVAVHEAIAQAITDPRVRPRAGAR